MKCPFCEEYRNLKSATDKEHEEDNRYFTNHRTAIVSECYFNGCNGGSFLSKHYDLNYCPVCGKELKESENG